jgi:hypothetical protein
MPPYRLITCARCRRPARTKLASTTLCLACRHLKPACPAKPCAGCGRRMQMRSDYDLCSPCREKYYRRSNTRARGNTHAGYNLPAEEEAKRPLIELYMERAASGLPLFPT